MLPWSHAVNGRQAVRCDGSARGHQGRNERGQDAGRLRRECGPDGCRQRPGWRPRRLRGPRHGSEVRRDRRKRHVQTGTHLRARGPGARGGIHRGGFGAGWRGLELRRGAGARRRGPAGGGGPRRRAGKQRQPPGHRLLQHGGTQEDRRHARHDRGHQTIGAGGVPRPVRPCRRRAVASGRAVRGRRLRGGRHRHRVHEAGTGARGRTPGNPAGQQHGGRQQAAPRMLPVRRRLRYRELPALPHHAQGGAQARHRAFARAVLVRAARGRRHARWRRAPRTVDTAAARSCRPSWVR